LTTGYALVYQAEITVSNRKVDMDARAMKQLGEALLTVAAGVEAAALVMIETASTGEPAPPIGKTAREIQLIKEWDHRGLTRAEARALCLKHGFNGQKIGGWARGEWVVTKDGRRYLTAKTFTWLSTAA